MSELTVRRPDGAVVEFEPEQARAAVTAYNAHAEVLARQGHADEAHAELVHALGIQRRFVLWWDAQEKDRGGRPGETGDRSVTGLKLPADLDKKTVSRWRKRLVVPDAPEDTSAFEAECDKARAKVDRWLGGKAEGVHVEENSGENEWYTPPAIIECARRAMGGIDLDPASCAAANETVQAATYYDRATNGLEQRWHGRVWMNPPYATPLVGQFVAKLIAEWSPANIDQAVVLVNNATDTQWGQALLQASNSVCFLAGRVRFIDKGGNPSGAPLQGQMVCYLGGAYADFRREFEAMGRVFGP